MRGRNTIWTSELRSILYDRIVAEFGPHARWNGVNYPRGKAVRMEEVLKELAVELSKKSGHSLTWRAVGQQLHWGITDQPKVHVRQLRQFLLNKAAAVEAGLVHAESVEKWIRTERKSASVTVETQIPKKTRRLSAQRRTIPRRLKKQLGLGF